MDKIVNASTSNSRVQLFGRKTYLHSDTPVFDGQFSNRCYAEAVKDAFTISQISRAQWALDPEDKPSQISV